MATEKQLIEVSAARGYAESLFADPILKMAVNAVLNKTPKVDAVEVVRCKDCAFWTYEGVGSSTLKRFGSCAKWYPFGNEQHSCHDDDFCSYAERRMSHDVSNLRQSDEGH